MRIENEMGGRSRAQIDGVNTTQIGMLPLVGHESLVKAHSYHLHVPLLPSTGWRAQESVLSSSWEYNEIDGLGLAHVKIRKEGGGR